MSIYQIKVLNFWRDRKNIAILCIYILMIFSFFIYSDKKIEQEHELLTQQMEEKLYIGDVHAKESIIEEQFSGDSTNILAAFRLRNEYIQNWTDHKIVAFQRIEEKTAANYLAYLTALPDEIRETLDEDEFPPEIFAANKVKQIEQLNKLNLSLEASRYGNDGSSFLTSIIYFLTSFLGIFLFLFLFGDFLSSDYEKQTIRLIYTTSNSKRSYLLQSLNVTMSHAILLFCGIMILSFGLATAVGGVGQVNYPLISPIGSNFFIPAYSYWLQVSILFFCVLLFVFLWYEVITLFTKHSLLSAIGTCSFLFVMNKLSLLPIFRYVAPFNPFVYLEASNVFIGKDFTPAYFSTEAYINVEYEMIVENLNYYLGNNLATILKNPTINFTTGLIVLLISSFLVFICLNIVLKRKSVI
jgi:hypothetical protein